MSMAGKMTAEDDDGDGIANDNDNCPFIPNADQNEDCAADMDGDGIANAMDNCPEVANPGQEEVAEGRGAACWLVNPPPVDGDEDGVPDAIDNCPAVENLEQTDLDENGVGDVCQLFFVDEDGDGIADHLDNCKLPNPQQLVGECERLSAADTDEDGVNDGLDTCIFAPNPEQAPDDVCVADRDADLEEQGGLGDGVVRRDVGLDARSPVSESVEVSGRGARVGPANELAIRSHFLS